MTPVQVSNLTGTYKAVHRSKPYTMIVQQANAGKDNKKFLVSGFFDERKNDFWGSLQGVLSQDIETIKQGLCDTCRTHHRKQRRDIKPAKHETCDATQTALCAPDNRTNQIDAVCAERRPLITASAYYLHAPGMSGMLFRLSERGKPYGDYFEYLKGNILLPEKEYRVSGVALNDNKELSRMVFKETGYVQFFTSEEFGFTKYSEDVSETVAQYVDTTDAVRDLIRRDPESVCKI